MKEVFQKINVFIVDDHELIRDGIRALLVNEEYVQVVGDARSSEDLIEKLKKLQVNVLLLDMYLPEPDGLAITKEVTENLPDVAVLILSGDTDEELILGAFQNGALGYLQKDITKKELLEGIYEVMDGKIFISSAIRNNLSTGFAIRARYGDKYSQSKLTCLTLREIDVIKFLAQGMISKEIAHEMNVSPRTVESHKRNIMEKLGLNSIVDIVKFAIKNKIVKF